MQNHLFLGKACMKSSRTEISGWSKDQIEKARRHGFHDEDRTSRLEWAKASVELMLVKANVRLRDLHQREGKFELEPGCVLREGHAVHNEDVAEVLRDRYAPQSLARVRSLLARLGTLEISALPNGLPRAATVAKNADTERRGYDNVWTRDAAFVSNAWSETGEPSKAAAALKGMIGYYGTASQVQRMVNGIRDGRPSDAQERPHIKFRGQTTEDLDTPWMHAQNDALGLFLRGAFRAGRTGVLSLTDADLRPLAGLCAYLHGIDFATDADDGHWEEGSEVGGRLQSSSLRCVLGGLQEARRWAQASPAGFEQLQAALDSVAPGARFRFDRGSLDQLIAKGTRALHKLLPLECDGKGIDRREADLALLSVVYVDLSSAPEDRLLDTAMVKRLLASVESLSGSHGDRRYLGDGYQAAYRGERGSEIREAMNARKPLGRLSQGIVLGGEAQWTLGAPLMSFIYGQLYAETGDGKYLEKQTLHFNRALGMITGDQSPMGAGEIPESYALVHSGRNRWRFTEHALPLNWSKANLRLALHGMERSLGGAGDSFQTSASEVG
jgi:hypothetical protein